MALATVAPLRWLDLQFHDADGVPAVGHKLYSYIAGTDTPLELWTDVDGEIAWPIPIVLDSTGRPGGAVYTSAVGYKYVLTGPDDDVPIWTLDHIADPGLIFSATFGLVMSEGAKNLTANYTLLDSDRLVTCNPVSPITITLLPAADAVMPVTIKNLGSATVSIALTGADTLEGLTGLFELPVADSPNMPTMCLISDGVSGWYVQSSHALVTL